MDPQGNSCTRTRRKTRRASREWPREPGTLPAAPSQTRGLRNGKQAPVLAEPVSCLLLTTTPNRGGPCKALGLARYPKPPAYLPSWFLERSRVLSCRQVHLSWGGRATSWFPCSRRNMRALGCVGEGKRPSWHQAPSGGGETTEENLLDPCQQQPDSQF